MHYGRPIQRCTSNLTTRKWQARTDVQTHSSIRDSSEHFQITAPSLIPSGWCSWSEAQQQRPWGGLELCQQLGPFQHSHVLFMDIHQLSSLIRQTLRQTSAETHACMHAHGHAHTRTNQGHEAQRNSICRNKRIKFASIWCVLWICERGCMRLPNPGHELHGVWIIKLPQFW